MSKNNVFNILGNVNKHHYKNGDIYEGTINNWK